MLSCSHALTLSIRSLHAVRFPQPNRLAFARIVVTAVDRRGLGYVHRPAGVGGLRSHDGWARSAHDAIGAYSTPLAPVGRDDQALCDEIERAAHACRPPLPARRTMRCIGRRGRRPYPERRRRTTRRSNGSLNREDQRARIVSGGVWKSRPLLFRAFGRRVQACYPHVVILPPKVSPVIGGILLGLEELGMDTRQLEQASYGDFAFPCLNADCGSTGEAAQA